MTACAISKFHKRPSFICHLIYIYDIMGAFTTRYSALNSFFVKYDRVYYYITERTKIKLSMT